AVPEVELAQRPADRFRRRVAVKTGRAPVPGGDHAALVVREDGVARLLDLHGQQSVLLLAATEGSQQGLDVRRHAGERLDAMRGLGRALDGDEHAVLTL